MFNRTLADGHVWFALGLLFSGISSLLDRFAGVVSVGEFMPGFFDGLAVIAFGAAVFFMMSRVRQRP